MRISNSFRSHFIREILLPLVLVLLITFVAASYTVGWATERSNAVALAQQQQIIKTSLSQSLSEMARQHRSLALWPPLARKLLSEPQDTAWFNQNVGSWLADMFEHQLVYIVDASGQPVYRWENGSNVPVAQFTHLRQPVEAMMRRLKAGDQMREIVDFTRIDNRPAALAIGIIGSDSSAEQAFMLISVKFLDDRYLLSLSRRSLLSDLRYISGHPAEAGANWLLTDKENRPLGYLAWQPEKPGTLMLHFIGPLVAVVALVEENLTHSLARLMRQQQQVALLLLDLDRFKLINDTYGHHAGDELIIEVGRRLGELINDGDTVGRLGGDEFVVIVNQIDSLHSVQLLCEKIIDAINRPFTLLGNDVWTGVSIGVTLAPEDASDKAEMMRKADIALYEAKSQGRGQFRLFVAAMDESVKTRQQVAADLRAALQSKQDLAVYYQPQLDMDGQKVVGLEALIRWNHPRYGEMAPTEFIPLAEEAGLIMQIGEWVLREACRVSLAWPDLIIAVNVSPLQFRTAGFAERTTAIIRQEKTLPSRIEPEITEGVLIEDEKGAQETISQLRQVGFRIALDDFGTGYSSLNYLSHFPVDKIKIDRSFTQSLGVTGNGGAIMESMVRLGQAMGLTVTAEGVETRSQMAALSEAGCNQLQGFYFSQAVPEAEIVGLLTPRKAG
ncbi:bifunctional diguanylate cyclase/phosphodiesterase [Erwinia mallotivora]|uniref:Diguanylate phosphodiesterase n=1 Tax=Erwinia mallotivora TaxID=69222 RepID=A0A014N9W9_9GAMM|nr:bifunctional diguanylate cyclase/phosphodiesterase [Erwinia mallotivora]EXU76183.1 diguanylate phosphodiesterase [Erwinia mallotivora]